ncbi:hypothetical protein CDEST_02330 [Colletotrichum destructivum]|uniref:DUF7136 domain-containing protein n=1 Tax=Colletotrichum destructivum TaxID=34406 RepID=A0AAX4I1R2_9PEZI|nr:hypothetical protein CDEST_02330 [Colletotrichum destructivum]
MDLVSRAVRFLVGMLVHLRSIADATDSVLDIGVVNERTFDLEWVNYSSEPYLLSAFMDFKIEGQLKLLWTTWWGQCDESGDEVRIINEKWPTNVGVATNVTGKTHDVPKPLSGQNIQYGTCAAVASSSPTPTSNHYRDKIDKATVESTKSNELSRRCRRLSPPACKFPRGGSDHPDVERAQWYL